MRRFKTKSQTATEYLVILAVVIVIALVTVASMGGFPGIGSSSNKKISDMKLASDVVGVENYNIGASNSTFKIKNNYYDTITVVEFRVNQQVNLTCNSSNTVPALPLTLNVGQSVIVTCNAVNTSTYQVSNKQTLLIGILYTDSITSGRLAGNVDIYGNTSSSLGAEIEVPEPPYVCTNDLPFDGGDGSAETPYIICSWTQLNNTRGEYLSANFILRNNLSSSDGDYDTLGNDWQPIGDCGGDNGCGFIDDNVPFTGNFNGNSNTISDLVVNLPSTNGVGFFGVTTGNISNLGLIDVSVTGSSDATGGLVGLSAGEISYSYSSGSLTGYEDIGGLVGSNWGTISNSYSVAVVMGTNYVGGLVGGQTGMITNSYSSGSVDGSSAVGGLVGLSIGIVNNSYSSASVSGTGNNVGGLVGDSGGTISSSYYDSTTSGQSDTGKGVPKTTAEMKLLYTFNSFGGANWNISGGQTDLNNGYPYLSMTGESSVWLIPDNAASPFAGGSGTVEDPYQIASWTQLNYVRYLLDKYFVLTTSLSSLDGDYDTIGNNWMPIMGCGLDEICGAGMDDVPFIGNFNGNNNAISNLVVNLPSNDGVGLFGLTTGNISNLGLIDVSITGHNDIGALVGSSYVWGSSVTISNCYSTGSVVGSGWGAGGLVGMFWDGTISDSYSSAIVSGVNNNVGGLVGQQSAGTISNSYSTGSAYSTWAGVGGLVGGQNAGTINNSYSTASAASAMGAVGGLVGASQGAISNSYSTGSVTGLGALGGLVGQQDAGAISNSYSISSVPVSFSSGGLVGTQTGGTVASSYYDTETSGQSDDAGKGAPKSTADMKTQGTFVGWDFPTIWIISPGNYPALI